MLSGLESLSGAKSLHKKMAISLAVQILRTAG
jgi:hypothetical protein